MTTPGDCRNEWSVESLGYLIYIGIVFLQPSFDPHAQWWEWAIAVGATAVFLPIYLLADRRPGPVRRWAPVLLTVLSVATILLNSGCVIYLVYAAGFVGDYRSRRRAMEWFAGMSLIVVVAVFASPGFPFTLFSFVPGFVFIWIVGLQSLAGTERHRERMALRVQNARIEHLATLTERERISRDLHDLLGHTLTGIIVRSQLAQRLAQGDVEAGVAEMAHVETAAREALAQVRTTVTGWRQIDLDDEIATSQAALAAADVALTVEREPGLTLAPTVASALGLALREAVTNVVRHANATRCTVTLRTDDDQVVLEIADDGVGGAAPEGNGLTGMRERITALGGVVTRKARGGTALTVAVPKVVAT
jgi:two-component system, NarL family, sensor histidine kinase DesK